MFSNTWATWVLIVPLLLASPMVATSQETGDLTDAELRARQQQLGQQLLDDPSNSELMFAHATASIQLRDYEAAITTLERLLIFNQDLPRVRLELGVAYFNLGSYGVSRLYLQQVIADETLDERLRDIANRYIAAIDKRTSLNQFAVTVNLGATYSSNANLGPADDTVTIRGIPGFVLSADGRSQEDFGTRILVYGAHSMDLERPNSDAWLTNFSLYALRYGEVEDGNTLATRLRTGPWLNLTEENNGAKVRPYIDLGYLNGDDESIYFSGFAGAEYTVPITESTYAFGDLGAGYLDFQSGRNADDRFGLRMQAGVAYQPTSSFTGRASLIGEYYDAREERNSSLEFGGRVSGDYSYDSGIEAVDGRWVLSAFLDARYRTYSSADPFIDPNRTRDEFDLRGGISHLFAIRDNLGVRLDVEGFYRDSNIQNFDLNNQSVTISFQYRL